MPSWNDPTNSNPSHVEVLQDLADKDAYALTMGQTSTVYTDLPNGTMKADNSQKLLRRRQSGTDEVFVLSLAGSGTGSTSAEGARGTLEVLKAGTDGAEARSNTQNDGHFVQQTRTVGTTSPLAGGGALDGDLTLTIQDATTAQKGAVQLNNTLTSTSTSTALTAAQGKVLNDTIAGITDVGYYNSETLGPSNTLTSGSCKVVRVGEMIVISGSFNHTASTSRGSLSGYIPVWARPVNNVSNIYSITSIGDTFEVNVSISGILSFSYDAASSTTSGFTISYTFGA